jgi:hypothetical protein
MNGIGDSRKGEMCKMTQEVGSEKYKGMKQIWAVYKP